MKKLMTHTQKCVHQPESNREVCFQDLIICCKTEILLVKKTRTSTVSKPLDADGILVDIDVQSIDATCSSNTGKLDIDEFFVL